MSEKETKLLLTDTELKAPVIKVTTAWLAALLTDSMSFVWNTFSSVPWDKMAQFAAFVYSLCLIYEYISKRIRRKKENKDGTE